MRRMSLLIGSAATLIASTIVGVSEPASAVTCSTSWSNKDPGGGRTPNHSPIRSGPYEACTEKLTTVINAYFNYDCYVVNSYGNTWTHVSADGQSLGWIYDGNLDDGGSNYRC